MFRKIISTAALIVACIAVYAQSTCTINGTIINEKLSTGKKIKKVYLTRTNELGQHTNVATAKVKKGKYTIEYELAADEPVLMYAITGFGEGNEIELFVEPGEVSVTTASAAQASSSTIAGTPTNDLYSEYKAILNREPADAKEAIKKEAMSIKFLIDHNASPMTPLMVERVLLPKFSASYTDQMLKAMSVQLHKHPYYRSLRNKVLSSNMKVGNEVPDITLPLENGTTAHLANYRGKYIVLNFWTTGCEKSGEMLARMQELYDVIKEKQGQFVIISFALESDIAAWKEAIKSNNMSREGWLHACDGAGTVSPAAQLFKVEKAPKIVLIEPEGRAVSLDMETDEVIMRVEQILAGELYYLDNQE